MCGHCEAHVNKAIQAAFGAEDVVSSHENGTTVFSVPVSYTHLDVYKRQVYVKRYRKRERDFR